MPGIELAGGPVDLALAIANTANSRPVALIRVSFWAVRRSVPTPWSPNSSPTMSSYPTVLPPGIVKVVLALTPGVPRAKKSARTVACPALWLVTLAEPLNSLSPWIGPSSSRVTSGAPAVTGRMVVGSLVPV